MSRSKHLVVISAHNDYLGAWRASVAAYSCMRVQRTYPLILVHGKGPLEPEFTAAAREGVLVARAPNCSATSIFAHAGQAALDLGREFVVLLPVDVVWARKVSWPTELVRSEGILAAPAADVAALAEAWHESGLDSLGAARRQLLATNQSPGSISRRALLRYNHDHPCWRPSLATDRTDSQIAWRPQAIRSDTIQGRIHAEVRAARRFWTKEAVTA